MFIRDNLPRAYDFKWFAKAVGLRHRQGARAVGQASTRGEKVWFWGGVVGLIDRGARGAALILLFPNFDQTRAVMQDAWIWHAVAALLYIALSLGHIYLGTLGRGRRLPGDAHRLRRRGLGEGAPRDLVQRSQIRQARQAAGGAVPAGAPHMRDES